MEKRHIRAVLFAFTLIIIIIVLWKVRQGLYPFIIAILIAYILDPPVTYIQHRGLSRFWAIIMIYVISFIVILMIGMVIIPLLVSELESFAKEVPTIINKSDHFFQTMIWRYKSSPLPVPIRSAFDEQLLYVQRNLQMAVTGIVSSLIGLMTHIMGLAISPVLAYYMLYDCNKIKGYILSYLRPNWRYEFCNTLHEADQVLNGVIRGQIMVAVIVGICISSGLYFLHLKFALTIGILAGLLDIIPYFGPIIGAAPAVILAGLESPQLMIKVLLLFFIVHQVEGTIIGPKIIGERVGLHPLAVILVLFIGGELGGLTGMLIAVPISALLKVLLTHVNNLLK